MIQGETDRQSGENCGAGSGLSSERFDYSSVPCSVAKLLRGQADRIQRFHITSIIQIGRALLEAKRQLSHGAFIRWVEGEVCIPARTSQTYMRAAVWASDKGATVALLTPTALYLLSASSTPKEYTTQFLKRVEAGEDVPPSVIRKELKALRVGERQTRREAEVPDAARGELSLGSALAASPCGAIVKLADFLADRLSPAEFERIQHILTSEALRSHPQLARNLERAFLNAEQPAEKINASMMHKGRPISYARVQSSAVSGAGLAV